MPFCRHGIVSGVLFASAGRAGASTEGGEVRPGEPACEAAIMPPFGGSGTGSPPSLPALPPGGLPDLYVLRVLEGLAHVVAGPEANLLERRFQRRRARPPEAGPDNLHAAPRVRGVQPVADV